MALKSTGTTPSNLTTFVWAPAQTYSLRLLKADILCETENLRHGLEAVNTLTTHYYAQNPKTIYEGPQDVPLC